MTLTHPIAMCRNQLTAERWKARFTSIVTFHRRKSLADFGKQIRLRRILRHDRGTLVVAFDHALVLGPIPGTIDPARQIRRFVEAKADAILLNLTSIRYFAESVSSDHMPGLIARLDWTTAFNESAKVGANGFQTCLVAHPEDALRSGADAVITFLFVGGGGDPDFEKKEVERVGSLARECERAGIPLIVESLARGNQVENPRDSRWLMLHTRMAAELGADIIKTENAGDVPTMREVVRACPVPILVLGGSRTSTDEEVLNVVRSIVQSGAAGVFFGRNIFQADNMPELLQRVRSILGDQTPPQGK
jgi:DhnA family fructose-bisphosphate aldolase class Ia